MNWMNRLRTQTGFNAPGRERCIFLAGMFLLCQIKLSATIMVQIDRICCKIQFKPAPV